MSNYGLSATVMSRKGGSCNACGVQGNLGPADCIDGHKLRPRRQREIVIQQIKEYVLIMLGAPTVRIEFDDQALDMCVKQTLKVMEIYAPREFFTYYTFMTTPGKSIYKMPPEVGYIRTVEYQQTPNNNFFSAELGGSIPINYLNPGGSGGYGASGFIDPTQPMWGRLGEWTLYKQYERMYARSSSGIGGWEWVGGYRNIKLYPIPYRNTPVIVHYMPKCYDWEEVTLCMQEGALAHAKMILGRIRGKIKNPPGPNGGIQLDGDQLMQEGKEEYEKWKEDLVYRWGDIPPMRMG